MPTDTSATSTRAITSRKGTVLAVVQKDQYQQKLDQAKASLAKSNAEHERAKLSFDRMTVLYKAGAATQPDYDDSRAQEQSTQAAVDNANAQIAEAQLALSYCDLRAPFDSWVLKRNVDLGTLVGPATNGFTLADTRTVKAVFGVPDTAIGRIKLGSPQTVTTEALPNPFSGHVTAISAAADPKSRVYSVEVRIDNPQEPAEGRDDRVDHYRHALAGRRRDGGADLGRGAQPGEPERLCGVRYRRHGRHGEGADAGHHAGEHLRQHDRRGERAAAE